MWTVTVIAIEMKSKQQGISDEKLFNKPYSKKPFLFILVEGEISTEIPASLSWKNLVSLLKCLWWNKSFDIAANFICKTFLFFFRSSLHFLVAWIPFCTLNIFQSSCDFRKLSLCFVLVFKLLLWNVILSVLLREESVKFHVIFEKSLYKLKFDELWLFFAESMSSATEQSLRNLSCELCFAFLFELSFLPSLSPLFKLEAFPVCVNSPLACFKFFSLWHSLWLRVLVFDTQRWNSSKI